MLGTDRVRTLTIHTRKEVIAIFEELKNKINQAYEEETEGAFQALLTIIKVIYYLHPTPGFLKQINQISTITVTALLQSLLVKTSMVKLTICKQFRKWVVQLMLKFKDALPQLQIEQIKQMKQISSDSKFDWKEKDIVQLLAQDFSKAINSHSLGTIASLVYFLRIFFIFQQQKGSTLIIGQGDKWKKTMINIVQSSRVIDNIKLEELNVSISYYLCFKATELCEVAFQSGIVPYLTQLLNSKYVTEPFGRRIVEFMKFILLQISEKAIATIDIQMLQKRLSQFIFKFESPNTVSSIHDLVSLLQKKGKGVNHQDKLIILQQMYSRGQTNILNYQNILGVINLYAHNDKMSYFIVKYYPALLSRILFESNQIDVVRMILPLLSYNFKKGKFNPSVAAFIIDKIDKIVKNPQLRHKLMDNRKQIITELVKIVSELLQNRQHLNEVIGMAQTHELQQKLWQFSDTTNFMFQKELIKLCDAMGNGQYVLQQQKQRQVLIQLQNQIITNSRINLNKPTVNSYKQIQFMEHLVSKNQQRLRTLSLSEELAPVIANYIQISNYKTTFTLLDHPDNEEAEILRKQFNFICCKLLTELLRGNNSKSEQIKQIKHKMIALTSSTGQMDQIYELVKGLYDYEQFVQQQQHQHRHLLHRQICRKKQKSSVINHQLKFKQFVKHLFCDYFTQNCDFDINLLRTNDIKQLQTILQQLTQYQNQAYLLKYLKLVLELAHKQTICSQIYEHLSIKLLAIYKYILQTHTTQTHQQVYLLQSIFQKMIKYHIHTCFNDQTINNQLSFYAEILTINGQYFDIAINHKKIALIQLILEYLNINKIQPHEPMQLISKKNNKDKLKIFIDNNKAEGMGSVFANLLCPNINRKDEELLWLQHKQNLIQEITNNHQNTASLKFIQKYIKHCSADVFNEYQLTDVVELTTNLLDKQLDRMQVVTSHQQIATLKLRKIRLFSLILKSLNSRTSIKLSANALNLQQQIIIKAIANLTYYKPCFIPQQFKYIYLQEITAHFIAALALLYKHNFSKTTVKASELIDSFSAFLQLEGDQPKNGVCSLMRVLMLQQNQKIFTCPAFLNCKQYKSWLPTQAQQHITACIRIEQLLTSGKDLKEEMQVYFQNQAQQNQAEPLQSQMQDLKLVTHYQSDITVQTYNKQIQDLQEPLFKQFASSYQPQVKIQFETPKKEQVLFQQMVVDTKNLNMEEHPIIKEVLSQIIPDIKPKNSNDYEKEMLETVPAQEQKQNKTQIQTTNQENLKEEQPIITQSIQVVTEFTAEHALAAVKAFIKEPFTSGIKSLAPKLIKVQSYEYAELIISIFMHSEQYYDLDHSPSIITLAQVQQKLVQVIPESHCKTDELFYKLISKNLIGASICIRKKGIGLNGLQILCSKFLDTFHSSSTSQYAQMIAYNAQQTDELKYLHSCKIYEIVNYKLPVHLDNMPFLTAMCKLISSTCKYPPFRIKYDVATVLINHLTHNRLPIAVQKQALLALCGLIRDCEKHKKVVQNTSVVHHMNSIISKRQENVSLLPIVFQFLSNLLMNNPMAQPAYQQANFEQKIMQILKQQINQSKYNQTTFLHLLNILELMSHSPQSCIRYLKLKFMNLCHLIAKNNIKLDNCKTIHLLLSILLNIISSMEINLARVIGQLQNEGFTQFMSLVSNLIGKAKSTEVYLEIFCKTLQLPNMVKKCMSAQYFILKIMNTISKNQQTNLTIVQKWLKILFQLLESHRYNFATDILKSNIFYSAANYLKPFQALTQFTVSINMKMIKQLMSREDPDSLLIRQGYADFAIQNLRMKNLQLQNYLIILELLLKLQRKKVLPSNLCTKMFEIAITKLQQHWKDEVALKSISLLKRIKSNVEVTEQFGQNMFVFFCNFLTQSNKITSYQYYSISRQVICLMSYYINSNDHIKLLFRDKIIVDILKNWLRVAKALEYKDMPQTYKLCLFSIENQQSLTADISQISSSKFIQFQNTFERGWKCLLYRLDGSNKHSIIRLDKNRNQIVAFKFPDGQIKDKYRLPIKDIVVVSQFDDIKSILFKQSNFVKSSSPFQKKADPNACATILSLCEQGYEVRQISIQFQGHQDKQLMLYYLLVLSSKLCQSKKQQQLQVWSSSNRSSKAYISI